MDTGDSLGRTFVFLISFLGLFVLLVGTMPAGFYATAPDYEARDYPSYWTSEDIKTLTYSDSVPVNTTQYWFYLKLERDDPLTDVDLKVTWSTIFGRFMFKHWWYQWGWLPIEGDVEPYPIWESDILDNIDETGLFSRFETHCDHHNYVTYFAFDNETYATLEEALNAHEIIVSMGMGWDYESGALSGWDLIGRLLFFQAPDITPELNAIIALPIWAMVGVTTFLFIMVIVKSLPFT